MEFKRNRRNRRAGLWVLPLFVVVTLLLIGCGRNRGGGSAFQATPTPHIVGGGNLVTYQVVVDIVSGTQEGTQFAGAFAYDPTPLINSEGEQIFITEMAFCYLDVMYTETDMDPFPAVQFFDGQFQRLVGTGGDVSSRFGFNQGYDPDQFLRDSELFVFNGEDFFGYMNDTSTRVDGVGRISYSQLNPGEIYVVPPCGGG